MDYLDSKFEPVLLQSVDLNSDQMKDSVLGGFVGDPMNNSNEGIEINGRKSSKIFFDCGDLDFKSMYPYIQIKNNIERTVQYFRLIIFKPISEKENRRGAELFWRGGEFIEDYTTKNIYALVSKWFGLKSIYDYIKEFQEIQNKKSIYEFKFKEGMDVVKFYYELKGDEDE